MSTIVTPRQKQLLDELRSRQLTHHLKLAGPDVKKTFEENFAQLTDTIIDEHFPRLKKYDLGFQLVDKSSDNTEAFGVRGLRLRTLAFIPFFYNNGTVGGYEILYLPRLNIFLPSTDPWIVFLTTNADEPLGKPDDRFKEHYTKLYPNLLPLRRPITFKTASDSQKRHLPYFLEKYAIAGKRLYALIDKAPWLVSKLAKFYGPEILDLVKRSAAREIYRPLPVNSIKQAEIQRKLRIYSEFQDPDEYLDLSIPEREELFKKGYLVKDARDETEVSKAVPVVRKEIFFPVDSPGVYRVIDANFQPREVLAFYLDNTLCCITRQAGPLYCIGSMKDNFPVNLHPVRRLPFLYAIERVSDFDESPWVMKTDVEEARKRGHIFDRTGKGYTLDRYSDTSILQGQTERIGITVRNLKPGTSIKTIIAPKTCYCLKYHTNDRTLLVGHPETDNSPDIFLSPDVLDIGPQPVDTIKLSFDLENQRYILNNRSCSRFDALKSLILDYGLNEKQAIQIIRDAEFNKVARYWVKRADPFLIRQDDQPSPMFLDAPQGVWAPGYSYRTKLEADLWVPGLKRPQPVRNILDVPPAQVLQKIKQLADANDGEAFDLALINTLLYTTNIDEYIPVVIRGLDGMCRILFMLYRHQKDFKERYGESDYKRILESLKSSIESVGDLVVDLSQRKIDPYIQALESEQFQDIPEE